MSVRDVRSGGARWSTEQVLALAPRRNTAARPLAVAASWSDTGCDERAVWGTYRGSRSEPYVVMADHAPAAATFGARCTCPSRVTPCKHAIALMLMWAHGDIAPAARPDAVSRWVLTRGDSAAATEVVAHDAPAATTGRAAATDVGVAADARAAAPLEPSVSDERRRRLEAGLVELERWIDDRVRVGLGDPSIARYATWDDLAARLVDAQAGGLANRVRRVAGQVGVGPDWHRHVLAEMGVLHVLARAGRRLHALDQPWRDGVAAAIGITVRRADVLAQVPETATWAVMGRSDTVEDRIVVRRTWLRALDHEPDDSRAVPRSTGSHGGWAVLLSFAAHGQALESPLGVGAVVTADLHRHPGTVALRALLGVVHETHPHLHLSARAVPVEPSLAAARASVGAMLALEPWLERVPMCVRAAPTVIDGSWALTDHSGALSLLDETALPTLLVASEGRAVTLTVEWTPLGIVPLTVHLDDRVLDLVGGDAVARDVVSAGVAP